MMTRSRYAVAAARMFVLCCVLLAASVGLHRPAVADALPEGTIVQDTGKPFAMFVEDLRKAIAHHEMGIVAEACATCGAAKIGVTIPGNRVLMIFHPRYAVRMLEASVPAGIEAPLRLYVTETGDGTARLSYREPSAVFAPYDSQALDAMATELDRIVAEIARDALAD